MLKALIETQKLDTLIISRQKQIEQIPKRISAMQRPLSEARARLEARKRKFEAAEKKKRDREAAVLDMEARIEKLKERTPQIKTNQEYTALLKEIEAAEKEKYAAEDDILELMETVEAESVALEEAEAALKAEELKAEELKKELQAEVVEAEAQLAGLKEKRNELTAPLDEDTYGLYMKLLQSKDGLAVAPARAEVCQGCYMNIMPQLFVELKKNAGIIQCPQCNRILYYEEEEAPR